MREQFYQPWQLRATFARSLSDLYGSEVPAYTELVEVSHGINREIVDRMGAAAERLGSIGRVTAERHGAIRVGTPRELAQVATIFGAMGMHPVGFYDLRDTVGGIPVVSTAFRPTDKRELARNPFRVFTSLLATSDRRYFTADLQQRLDAFLARRTLFPHELLDLAARAEADGGLDAEPAGRFLDLATASFALSREPVDRAWYAELERVSSVAADIGGVGSTHINHLTPRVLDIDELYRRMGARGITMIDDIQGPPRFDGPAVLLRQTSFRALSEPRRFLEADGSVVDGELRVRFGEVEARGIALTPAGRTVYAAAMSAVDEALAGTPRIQADARADAVWADHFPRTERDLAIADLGWFEYSPRDARVDRADAAPPHPSQTAAELVSAGWLTPEPIVYEDFLPRSAAGIFVSNLTSEGSRDETETATGLDEDWLAGVLGRDLADPMALYRAQSEASLSRARAELVPAAR